MQINPPVVFTFTRHRWSSTTFSLLLAFDVWASNTYFTLGSSYLFFLAAACFYFQWKCISYDTVLEKLNMDNRLL